MALPCLLGHTIARHRKTSHRRTMLHNYILRQAVWPLLAAVSALGALALLTHSISTLDLIIDQRQTLITYMQITLMAMPQLIALILPLGVYVAALYALNRLQADSELIVCSAAGMGRWQIAAPVIKLAITALIINLAVNLWVQPTSFRNMRELIYEVRADIAAKLVRPGQFHSPAPGLTIYTRETERGGRMIDLLIEDSSDADREITYMAKVGQFDEFRGEPALVMLDGSIQFLEQDGSLYFLRFDSYPFELNSFLDGQGNLFYKLSDRYLHQLLFPSPDTPWDWRNRNELLAEGHYRLSSPLYTVTFALIAMAAVLGGQFSRKGYARRIIIASVAALLVRIAGFSAQSASADAANMNVLQYAVPVIAALVALMMIIKPERRMRQAEEQA